MSHETYICKQNLMSLLAMMVYYIYAVGTGNVQFQGAYIYRFGWCETESEVYRDALEPDSCSSDTEVC